MATAVGSLQPAYSIDVMHKRHNAQRQHIIHSVSAITFISSFFSSNFCHSSTHCYTSFTPSLSSSRLQYGHCCVACLPNFNVPNRGLLIPVGPYVSGTSWLLSSTRSACGRMLQKGRRKVGRSYSISSEWVSLYNCARVRLHTNTNPLEKHTCRLKPSSSAWTSSLFSSKCSSPRFHTRHPYPSRLKIISPTTSFHYTLHRRRRHHQRPPWLTTQNWHRLPPSQHISSISALHLS